MEMETKIKYQPKNKSYDFKIFLGRLKNRPINDPSGRVYLGGFSWDCDWYWGGGGISTTNIWTHFDGCFLDCPDSRGHSLGHFFDPWTKIPDYLKKEDVQIMCNGGAVWENLDFFLDNVNKAVADNWWRIKDLYKQFYALREAAAILQSGGHCTNEGRNPAEINYKLAARINQHIEEVIIAEIVKTLEIKL